MQPEETSVAGVGYPVSCFACHQDFDALTGDWCGCLTSKRSIVCPSCRSCFCKSPAAYRQMFWEKAPQAMWDRAMELKREVFQAPPNLPVASAPRPLVLVVDDEPDLQRAAMVAIQELGYGAIFGKDGVEGLELARHYQPDLVLADAFMPRLDGREMCRQIKNNPLTSNLKVVILTAMYTAARYRSEAFREFHADDYLFKPLEFRDLRAVLARHIGAPAPR
ncbi:MAG TPA: response regulator [Thermoanaerobaculia bacterium]|nr:response regulator [Thermoanaerobaculia bacterium]